MAGAAPGRDKAATVTARLDAAEREHRILFTQLGRVTLDPRVAAGVGAIAVDTRRIAEELRPGER